ncbi:hypothetical protein PR048_027949 [Dryococelus australis]|uniref:Transposase n=1 Tax=Dryococelus australis TaxID=614101 RepID=A0ABQ9GHV6_9NEOP|nr:hypothetical protein PR048_027949 [Dryococelus australis]
MQTPVKSEVHSSSVPRYQVCCKRVSCGFERLWGPGSSAVFVFSLRYHSLQLVVELGAIWGMFIKQLRSATDYTPHDLRWYSDAKLSLPDALLVEQQCDELEVAGHGARLHQRPLLVGWDAQQLPVSGAVPLQQRLQARPQPRPVPVRLVLPHLDTHTHTHTPLAFATTHALLRILFSPSILVHRQVPFTPTFHCLVISEHDVTPESHLGCLSNSGLWVTLVRCLSDMSGAICLAAILLARVRDQRGRPICWFSEREEDGQWKQLRAHGRGSTHSHVAPLMLIRGSINTEAYCNILDNEMLPTLWRFYGMDPSYFQDDNARCHVSRATMQWYTDNSPDLNPIEHLWDELDRRVSARQARPKSHVMVARGMATNPRGCPANTRREHARYGGCCYSRKRWSYEILTELTGIRRIGHSISTVVQALGFPRTSVSRVYTVSSGKTTAARDNCRGVQRVNDGGRRRLTTADRRATVQQASHIVSAGPQRPVSSYAFQNHLFAMACRNHRPTRVPLLTVRHKLNS